jgi:hypothetical protein
MFSTYSANVDASSFKAWLPNALLTCVLLLPAMQPHLNKVNQG